MKKYLVLVLALVLLFAQCKKVEMINEDETEMIPFSVEIPMNGSKTYFGDVINYGEISWGNIYNEEYFYLAVGYDLIDENNIPHRKGVLHEFKAIILEVVDKVDYKGMLPRGYLRDGRKYELYYFGNNGSGMENTNVTNIYDEETKEVIGKTVIFNNQNGDWRHLGDYHIASVTMLAMAEKDANGTIIGYTLRPQGMLKNKMAIAVLDLNDETTLGGSATYNSVYELKWNGFVFEENVYSNNMDFNVGSEVVDKSFISLLPNENRVTLECSKGSYTFENGVMANTIYTGGGETIDDVKPLRWRKP